MLSDDTLLFNLDETIRSLDKLAVQIYEKASSLNINAYELKSTTGELMLAPIVIARANAFAAYTNLRAQQMMASNVNKYTRSP
jgi:hypothetical protein